MIKSIAIFTFQVAVTVCFVAFCVLRWLHMITIGATIDGDTPV
jgi:hypothetical protein